MGVAGFNNRVTHGGRQAGSKQISACGYAHEARALGHWDTSVQHRSYSLPSVKTMVLNAGGSREPVAHHFQPRGELEPPMPLQQAVLGPKFQLPDGRAVDAFDMQQFLQVLLFVVVHKLGTYVCW